MTSTVTAVKVRWMVRRDIPQVLEIEQGGMGGRWTGKRILRALRQRNTIGMVAESPEGRILGWFLYTLQGGPAGWVRLHALAIHQNHRRRGLGGKLLASVCEKQVIHRRPVLVWTVPENNLGAQLLARGEGMVCERIVRDKFDNGEAGYRFVRRIPRG